MVRWEIGVRIRNVLGTLDRYPDTDILFTLTRFVLEKRLRGFYPLSLFCVSLEVQSAEAQGLSFGP
jgi:hypothetical protein